MDDDCDSILVIDLDEEQEEKRDVENYGNEIRPIDDNKVNRYSSKEGMGVGTKYDRINHATIASLKGNDCNSDDDIQVIDDDDDDDYENSVRNLVIVANKVGKEYRKNKQSLEAEDYRKRKSDIPELMNNFVNRGHRNRLGDSKAFNEEQNQISRDRVSYFVKENQSTVRSGYEPDGYPARYVMARVPYFVDENNYRPTRRDVAYRFEAPQVDMYKPETVSIDEYYALANRYAHHNPPEVPSNDKYSDAAINMNAHRYIYRPEVLSIDEYRRVNRDTNRYYYGNDEALNMHDYNYRQGTIYRDYNHVFTSANLDDGYNCGPTNRFLYNQSHRPELALSNDHYGHATMKRDACSHIHQQERFINDDCMYRYVSMNRFPYSHAHVDDYWKMSKHAFRPEIISIDCDRTAMNRQCSNEHRSDLHLPHYRSEQSHLYRPDLLNISAFREPLLTRHTYPEGTYGYIPQVSHYNAYRAYNNEAILNLSRRSKSIKVANTSNHEMNGSKLRTILNRNYIPKSENHMHEKNQRKVECYRTTTDNIRRSDNVLNTNKSEMHINTHKSGVPVRENSSNTVILSTHNVYQKGTLNTRPQTDALVTTDTMKNRYDYSSHTVKVQNHESLIKTTGHEDNEIQKNIVIEGDTDKSRLDNNIRFLVVFFSRVKELVKETFPEFSKSLVREIENLGQLASNGKMKTDIQFICPLYCSVSTYSLPRLGSIDDDNKIEKHKNRTAICDVCSCIQKCYKLYKKKYFNLLSIITNEREGIENKTGRKRKIVTPLAGSIREHTVICAPKRTKFEENKCDNDLVINKESRTNTANSNTEGNLHKVTLEHNNAEEPDNVINPWVKLNEKTDSLSILKFNTHANNINRDTLNDHVKNKNMAIGKSFQNTFNENEELINVFKTTVDKNSPDEAEANLILSLSYNDITNADIISSKLKNKSGRKPDAVFTCHICTCIFTYFTSFLSHMQQEHNINGIDQDIPDDCVVRKCPFCGMPYSKQTLHNEHVESAHPEIYTHKGSSEIQLKVDKRRSKKRKFIFTCLVCQKNLKSSEVKRHREKEHKGVNVSKMFTKKLSTLDY